MKNIELVKLIREELKTYRPNKSKKSSKVKWLLVILATIIVVIIAIFKLT